MYRILPGILFLLLLLGCSPDEEPMVPDSDPLPVFRITIDEKYLWSADSGLFVVEKPVNWEFPSIVRYELDEKKEFVDTVGFRIKGNYSLTLPNRSMALYWRSEYGKSRLKHQFFEDSEIDKFKRIKLRNGGTDPDQLFIKDAVLSRLIGELNNVEVANSRPVEVYINEEYWGLYNMRDLITPRHFQYKYGFDNESITMLQGDPNNPTIDDGDKSEYMSTVQPFLNNSDMSLDENVDFFFDHYMDKSSFIDYYASEIYLGNWDWPLNNMKWWGSSESTTNKWKWIAHDLDQSLTEWHIEHLWIGQFYLNTDEITKHHGQGFYILDLLLSNKKFRVDFFSRFIEIIDNTFSPHNFDRVAQAEIDLISSHYEKHHSRWNHTLQTSKWIDGTNKLKSLNRHRNEWIRPQIQKWLEEAKAE